ncbi:magnesium transporter [Agarivorans sp. TSD2052]|uniref:magnesium transporter n=1 Tax=Agarivorans sp. TSD2052 TaxID=2937286 RepID=UPI0020108305|nr:magnesium transporter [Agarivorans sp. TSD2052]UPW17170.1 magnesium transporter [Agarivorans sp. TSD2052]
MSNNSTPTESSRSLREKSAWSVKATLSYISKLVIALCVLVGSSLLLSKLATIHGKQLPESYFSQGYPSILKLLDSEIFMGFVFFVTVAILVYLAYLFWCLHEVAVHKAAKMSSAHTQIIFALSLCGLFIDKTWWVLAIIIAFARWDVLARELSNIIRNGRAMTKRVEE